MIRQLHKEFYRLFRSPLQIIVIILLILISVIVSARGFKTKYDLALIFTYRSGSYEKHLDFTKKAAGLPDSEASDIDELFEELSEVQYPKTFSVNYLWLEILVLPFLLAGLDFKDGSIAAPLRLGVRRGRIAAGKIALCYIITAVISLISVLSILYMYSSAKASESSYIYILRCLLLRIMLDLAALSVPLLLVFLLKRPFFVFITSLVSAGVYEALYKSSSEGSCSSYLPIPSVQTGSPAVWLQEGSSGAVFYAFAVAAVYIAVCCFLINYSFGKARLK